MGRVMDAADDEVYGDEPELGEAEAAEELEAAAEDEGEDDGEESQPPSLEEVAKSLGWKPKSKWKGEGWVDADQFIRNLHKQARRREEDIERRVEARLARMDARQRNRELTQTKSEYDAAIRAAAKAGDEKAADALLAERDEEIAKLQADPEQQERTVAEQIAQAAPEWFLNANEWLLADDAEAEEALEELWALGQQLAKEGVYGPLAWRRAQRHLKEAYEHKYDDEGPPKEKRAPERRKPAALTNAGRARAGDPMLDRLPKEAREQLAKDRPKLIGKGKAYATDREWAATYWDGVGGFPG